MAYKNKYFEFSVSNLCRETNYFELVTVIDTDPLPSVKCCRI